MGISNLNNVHLTDEQITAINEALTQLEGALEVLKVNLTSEDRNRYGRVNEQNKLFINKVNEFALSQPQLRSIDVNWDEFFRDFKSRQVCEGAINRLESLLDRLKNAKILHDYDNYQDALNDYAYTGFRAGSNAVGFEQKHRELKQFFAKNRKGAETTDPNEASE
ncbi:hypothetical protein [Capnocytophaga canimorsus]|uniref:hypothetical protein n=1 Tax=Capnocytophaga canimorsus TaxID=28188 RepID=UPI000F6E6D7F|nr:hypothetical protein [Capnocytophaga canimorsus]VEJ18093.1 Uncharacterised protein [Capnocytophaga canimorsus]